jgi:hypothetical protein
MSDRDPLIERVRRMADDVTIELPSAGAAIRQAKRRRAASIALRSVLVVGMAFLVIVPLILLLPLGSSRGPASSPSVNVSPQPPISIKSAVWTFASAPGWSVSQGEITADQVVAGAWTANVPFHTRDLPMSRDSRSRR